MSNLQHPTEADCIIRNIATNGALVLDHLNVLHKLLQAMAGSLTDPVHKDQLALARGSLNTMVWRVTDSQHLTGRLSRVMRDGD
jgi:hypothetical protein